MTPPTADEDGRGTVAKSWVRSAFWVGQPHTGQEDAFRDALNAELVPALMALPAVENARALWPRRLEDAPPVIFCQIIVEFASLEALERMLASPERAALRGRVRQVAGMFDGAISHIDYEVA